jgi:hypothetical protein
VAVTFIAAGAIAYDLTDPGSVTPEVPAHQADDILIVAAYNQGTYPTNNADVPATATAGWTQIASIDGNEAGAWWWKRAVDGSTTGPVITSTYTDLFAICYVFRGCTTTGTPFEDATTAGNLGDASATSTTALITTTDVGLLVAAFLTVGDDTAWSANLGCSPPPPGWDLEDNSTTSQGTDCRFTVISAADRMADAYGIENKSTPIDMRNGAITAISQSITGNGGDLTSCAFNIYKSGSPTGNAVAKLHTHSGVFGTSSLPTGAALATSDTIDVTTISTTSPGLIEFTFSSPYTLADGTNYCLVLEYSGGDASNYIRVGRDATSPTHAGNGATYSGGAWGISTSDFVFFAITPEVEACDIPAMRIGVVSGLDTYGSLTLALIPASGVTTVNVTPSSSVGNATAPTPSETASVSVNVVVTKPYTAYADAPIPDTTQAAVVIPSSGGVKADAPLPTVTASATITPPPSAAQSDAPAPLPTTSVAITPPTAAAQADAPIPSTSATKPPSNVFPASCGALANAPVPSISVEVSPSPAPSCVADAPIPLITAFYDAECRRATLERTLNVADVAYELHAAALERTTNIAELAVSINAVQLERTMNVVEFTSCGGTR